MRYMRPSDQRPPAGHDLPKRNPPDVYPTNSKRSTTNETIAIPQIAKGAFAVPARARLPALDHALMPFV